MQWVGLAQESLISAYHIEHFEVTCFDLVLKAWTVAYGLFLIYGLPGSTKVRLTR